MIEEVLSPAFTGVHQQMVSAKMAKGPRRTREIVEMADRLYVTGIISKVNFDNVVMRMLAKNKLPVVKPVSPEEIREMRERTGLSQAAFARCLNLTASDVSKLERGKRKPRGAVAKLFDVVRRKGIETIL
jgi:putative transcriptional regulator